MEFDQQKAEEIIKKFELSPTTLNVWKNRGKIPQKYLDENFVKRPELTEHDKKEHERLIRVMQNEKINVLQVLREEGISKNLYADAIRKDENKRVLMAPNVVLKLKKNVQELRIKIKKTIQPLEGKRYFSDKEKESITSLLKDDRFIVLPLIGEGLHYDRHIKRANPNFRNTTEMQVYDNFEVERVLDKLAIFLIETAF